MILEIIRNVLAFNLMFSDCLQAYSIFPPVEKIPISSRPIQYECLIFTHGPHAQSYSRNMLIGQFEAVSSHAYRYLELKEMQIRTL